MATPGDVQRARARRTQQAAEQAAERDRLKAERRAANERNRALKAERERRRQLPAHERLAEAAASIEARWTLPAPTVSPEEIQAAQRATLTRVEVVEVVREITVQVPAPPLPPGSYTECEVCIGRGMTDRYGQVPAATEQLILKDPAGTQVAAIDTCPTHIPYVQTTARRRGFNADTTPAP